MKDDLTTLRPSRATAMRASHNAPTVVMAEPPTRAARGTPAPQTVVHTRAFAPEPPTTVRTPADPPTTHKAPTTMREPLREPPTVVRAPMPRGIPDEAPTLAAGSNVGPLPRRATDASRRAEPPTTVRQPLREPPTTVRGPLRELPTTVRAPQSRPDGSSAGPLPQRGAAPAGAMRAESPRPATHASPAGAPQAPTTAAGSNGPRPATHASPAGAPQAPTTAAGSNGPRPATHASPAVAPQAPTTAAGSNGPRPAHASPAGAPQALGEAPSTCAGSPTTAGSNARPATTSAPGRPSAPRLPSVPTDRPEVFALIRRIVMQRDLASAAGLLHVELGALLGARVVLALVGANRQISCPITADLRAAATTIQLAQIAGCAQQKRPYGQPRILMVPLDTQRTTVLVAYRGTDAPAFDAATQQLMLAVASRLDVLDHVLSIDVSERAQADADRASIFRPEALKAARDPQRAGELVHLAPRVVRFAVPAILALAVALVIAAAIVRVPNYTRGSVVVSMNGRNVLSDGAGRVSAVHVEPGQLVEAGAPLLTLDAAREKQELEQIETVYRDQLSTFLFDPTDDAARQSLAGVLVQRKGAQDRLDLMTVKAPVAGRVSAILASDLVQQGEQIATITPLDADASVVAFMPGSDRSRIQVGMKLQVELTGYSGTRTELVITEVGTEIIGAATARKMLGQKLADAVALPPLVVMVKATLPGATFQADGKTFSYFDGMDGIAEIEVDSKSFLSVILPTGD